MNSVGRMIMQAKMNEREDRMNRDRARDRNRESDRARDRESDRARGRGRSRGRDRENDFENDFEDDFEMDSRRGSSRMRDRGHEESLCLSKFDIARWSKMLKNADGTTGKRFDMREVDEVASQMNIRFDEYTEKEFCMTMNMLYSDLCEVNRAYVSPDKEAHYYAKLAQAWLEDDDGPTPSEKLALYFYCIADDE